MENMAGRVNIAMRIPGNWQRPGELLERMPEGFRLTPDHLVMPDGSQIDFFPMKADDQFADIFANSCRRKPTAEESQAVNEYTVNACLTGPGGTHESAQRMMQAAAALIRAGGAGVFIDNSGIAHGGSFWLELNDDAGPDALSFAYIGIVRAKEDLYTMGMHMLGRPDVAIRRRDHTRGAAEEEESIVGIIRYLCASDADFEEGHIIADENGPQYTAASFEKLKFDPSSPMYNPWGRLRLVSIQEIAENN